MHQGAAPIDTSVYSLNTLASIELGTIAGEYVLMQNEPATVFGLRSGGASTDLSSEVEEIELNLGMLLSAQDDGEKELGVDSFSWRGEVIQEERKELALSYYCVGKREPESERGDRE